MSGYAHQPVWVQGDPLLAEELTDLLGNYDNTLPPDVEYLRKIFNVVGRYLETVEADRRADNELAATF